jgi:hypothetical protein
MKIQMNRLLLNAIKKFTIAGLSVGILMTLNSGCGLLPFPSPNIPSTPSVQPAEESLPTPIEETEGVNQAAPEAPPAPNANDARQTVQNFLTAVQLDANSSLATQLLSPLLQAEAAQGEGLQTTLLKTAETIPSFEVSAARLNQDGQAADVEATLFLQKPVNMGFTLLSMDGMWKINEIKVITTAGDYPTTPEEVVQTFLIAYQERPDDMSNYLTATRRGNLPPGGSVGMLQILGSLEGVLVKSAVVNPDPPIAVIVAIIKSGGIDSQRQFILNRENDRWGIDEIQTIQ